MWNCMLKIIADVSRTTKPTDISLEILFQLIPDSAPNK